MAKILYYDLETTGVDPKKHAILQLAAIIEDDGKVQDEINMAMAPHKGAEITARALEVNGIDPKKLTARPSPYAQFSNFRALLDLTVDKFDPKDKLVLAGYNNGNFDDLFLREWFKRWAPESRFNVYGTYFVHHSLDGKEMIAWLNHCGMLHPAPANLKLQTVCDYLHIPLVDAHDASADIKATRQLIMRLLEWVQHDMKDRRKDLFLLSRAEEREGLVRMSQEMIDDGAHCE